MNKDIIIKILTARCQTLEEILIKNNIVTQKEISDIFLRNMKDLFPKQTVCQHDDPSWCTEECNQEAKSPGFIAEPVPFAGGPKGNEFGGTKESDTHMDLSNDDLIDCLSSDKSVEEQTSFPMPFQEELRGLINKHSKENGSNTPDYILAEYLEQCLNTFNFFVNRRKAWYRDAEIDLGENDCCSQHMEDDDEGEFGPVNLNDVEMDRLKPVGLCRCGTSNLTEDHLRVCPLNQGDKKKCLCSGQKPRGHYPYCPLNIEKEDPHVNINFEDDDEPFSNDERFEDGPEYDSNYYEDDGPDCY